MGSCLGSNPRAWCWELGSGRNVPCLPQPGPSPGHVWGMEGGVPSDLKLLSRKSICLGHFFAGRFSNDSCMHTTFIRFLFTGSCVCLSSFESYPWALFFLMYHAGVLSTLSSWMVSFILIPEGFFAWSAILGQWNVSSWSSPDPHHAGIMISSFTLQNCEKSTAVFCAAQSVRGRDSTGDLHSAVQTRAEMPSTIPITSSWTHPSTRSAAARRV